MILIEDFNQKADKHKAKHDYWSEHDVELLRFRLPVGDYLILNEKVADMLDRKQKRGIEVKMMDFLGTYDRVVDTKYGMQELYGDIVGKDHARFVDSLVLAQNNGIKMTVLIEEPGIESLDDVEKWKNPRREKWFKFNAMHKVGKALSVKIPKQPPVASETLMKAMKTMIEKYDVDFQFCNPEDSGAKVIEILVKGEDDERS